ncbi:MAG TPA: Fe(3+) ABC transporter substrate-binding protein [Gammaproteobacteria bacterium]
MSIASLRFCLTGLLLALLATACTKTPDELNIYSYREENLIKPLLDQFSAQTGIKVNLLTGSAEGLFERLQAEGENTPADLLITVDAGRLYQAKTAGLLQAADSAVLAAAIPQHLRDPDNQWFGLSYRARVIMYNKTAARPLGRYEDLVNPEWQGRLCMRSSSSIYNQSLLASIIAVQGETTAESWAKGIVANMARAPQGNDRSQILSVAIGECDVTLANTYYLANLLASADPMERATVENIGVIFPNQSDRGTHINVSGAGITKHAKHPEYALQLLEFMVSDTAQQWYAETNHEYPVKRGIPVSEIVKAWGFPFKTDTLNLSLLGEYNATAVQIFDRAGWK